MKPLFALMCMFSVTAFAADAPYVCNWGAGDVYQDVPCGRAKHVSSYNYDGNGNRLAAPRDAPPLKGLGMQQAQTTQRAVSIDFGTSPSDKFRKASAVIESILIDARKCDWALKVTKIQKDCLPFLDHFSSGLYAQTTKALASLDKEFLATVPIQAKEVIRNVEEIRSTLELAKLRAGKDAR